MPADACIAFGGEVVVSCPVSSSSSLASSSSLFAVVSSSSGISDNSSSSNAVLSSSSSSETPAVPSSSSVVPSSSSSAIPIVPSSSSVVQSSSSSAIPVVPSSSSVVPSSSSSGFYDLGDVNDEVEINKIGNAFSKIVDSFAEGNYCIYISFNLLPKQYWSQQSLTLSCYIDNMYGSTSLSEINCYPNTVSGERCRFDIINGTNLLNICFNKRNSGTGTNCWTN
jgi:hypothetical protein